MPQVLVLESFIGSDEELKRYANNHGVIPWALHDPINGRKKRQNVIDLSEQRAKELGDRKIVRVLTKSEQARVKDDPTGLSLDPHEIARKERENQQLHDLRKENADLQRQLAESNKALTISKPAPDAVDK